ncbi:DUF4275 family protein [Planococcus chinensis]|uniref:DUF4275 family protein n=1 Tax=Planococcus chinensis TaxID=272917 RepID=A0ABW4QGM4_9BACL
MGSLIKKQIELLNLKGIPSQVVQGKRDEFLARWEGIFAQSLSDSQKRKIRFHQSMWNVFSLDKAASTRGGKAISAFNGLNKKECFIFYAGEENALYLQNAKELKGGDLVAHFDVFIEDIYVVDREFAWTFVIPHELDCGPYFTVKQSE